MTEPHRDAPGLSPSSAPPPKRGPPHFVSSPPPSSTMPSQPIPAKPRILALHGFRTSANVLRFQARDMDLQDYDVHYMDAPHSASGPAFAVVQAFFPGPYFEWWVTQDGKYVGCAESLAAVRECERTHGPFVGVIGFSQGGCLAAMLTAECARDRSTAALPHLRCAVILSAFAPLDPDFSLFPPTRDRRTAMEVITATTATTVTTTTVAEASTTPHKEAAGTIIKEEKGEEQQQQRQNTVALPAFFCYGKTDFKRDDCILLSHMFAGAEAHEHAGEHQLPKKSNGAEALRALGMFMRKHLLG